MIWKCWYKQKRFIYLFISFLISLLFLPLFLHAIFYSCSTSLLFFTTFPFCFSYIFLFLTLILLLLLQHPESDLFFHGPKDLNAKVHNFPSDINRHISNCNFYVLVKSIINYLTIKFTGFHSQEQKALSAPK